MQSMSQWSPVYMTENATTSMYANASQPTLPNERRSTRNVRNGYPTWSDGQAATPFGFTP